MKAKENNKSIELALLCVILLFSFCIRIHTADFNREIVPGSDESSYIFSARNLLKYGMLTYDREGKMFAGDILPEPSGAVMPGYPIFLMFLLWLNDSLPCLISVHILLSVFTIFLTYKVLRHLGISLLASSITVLMLSLYPAYLYNADRILTETLFSALLMSFVYTFLRSLHSPGKFTWLVLSNGLLMCAVLVRAQALPFIIVEMFFLFYQGNAIWDRVKQCAVVLGIALLFLIPLWIRNWIQFHQFWLLTQSGANPKIWGAMPYFLDMESTGSLSYDQVVAVSRQANSGTYIKWRIFGFIKFMWYDIWDETLVHPYIFLKPFRMLHPLVVIPAIAGIPALIKKCEKDILFISCFPIAFTLMAMPFHGLPRYVFPSIPMIFILCGIYIEKAFNHIRIHMMAEAVPAETDEIENTRSFSFYVDRYFRKAYFCFACVFSCLLLYSVFIFPQSEGKEMSDFRLGRAFGISTDDVGALPVLESIDLTEQKNLWYIDNAIENADGSWSGSWDGTSILHVTVPQTEASYGRCIVSKVELDIPGGYWFDACTVYWTGEKAKMNFDESHVYGRMAKNRFKSKIVVYIDDNIDSLTIVPACFRGSSFSIKGMRVTKYQVKDG